MEGNYEAFKSVDADTVLDAIWLADMADGMRSNLAGLVSNLLQDGIISNELAKERLEPDLLEAANLIYSSVNWSKKQIRINTALLYKQHRFNLFREETEGYARLINGLYDHKKHADLDRTYEQVLRLIGRFSIDPNRVIDVAVDTAACTLDFGLVELLARLGFPAMTVSGIIGFKCRHLLKLCPSNEYLEGLFYVIALCIQRGLFALKDIWPYLPVEEAVSAKKSESTDPRETLIAHDSGKELSVDNGSQFYLAASLLRVGLFDEYEQANAQLKVSWCPILHRTICSLVKRMVGVDDGICMATVKAPPIDSLQYWLARLGSVGLYHDHALITLLIKQADLNEPVWQAVLVHHVFPSITISYGNPSLCFDLWNKLSVLPFEHRFILYEKWRDLAEHPSIATAHSHAKSDLRRLLRRLSKENVKQYGRLLGKLAHSNAVIVFPLLLEQCQAYDNLIPPVIDSCRFLTPLAYDILVFSLIEQLKRQAEHMKEDATNVASWLQRLASFIGQLCKRYAIDCRPIIAHLNGRMRQGRAVELIIMEELLSKLGNIEARWELSDMQVEMLSCGPILRSEAMPRNKRAALKLRSVLPPDTWLLIAAQRQLSAQRSNISNLKLASTLFDQATACFLQYTEFIGSFGDTLPDYTQSELNAQLCLDSRMTIWKTCTRTLLILETLPLRELFWALDFGDLHVPIGRYAKTSLYFSYSFWTICRYQSEIAKLKTLLITAESRKDRERVPSVITALERELKSRMQSAQSNTLLIFDANSEDTENVHLMIQDMFYPRAIMSAVDAAYTAKFVRLLHPRVNIFSILAALIDRLNFILIATTEREARHFGRFFGDLMAVLDEWHRDADKFLGEAKIKAPPPISPEIREDEGPAEELDAAMSVDSLNVAVPESSIPLRQRPEHTLMEYEEFREAFFEIHAKIVETCAAYLIPEGEFLRLRSTIIFLSTISSVFPRIKLHARTLVSAVKELKRHDAREDVKVMSVRLEASLRSARTVKEASFHRKLIEAGVEGMRLESDADEDEHAKGATGLEEGEEVPSLMNASVTSIATTTTTSATSIAAAKPAVPARPEQAIAAGKRDNSPKPDGRKRSREVSPSAASSQTVEPRQAKRLVQSGDRRDLRGTAEAVIATMKPQSRASTIQQGLHEQDKQRREYHHSRDAAAALVQHDVAASSRTREQVVQSRELRDRPHASEYHVSDYASPGASLSQHQGREFAKDSGREQHLHHDSHPPQQARHEQNRNDQGSWTEQGRNEPRDTRAFYETRHSSRRSQQQPPPSSGSSSRRW